MILKIQQKINYDINGTVNFGYNKLILTPQNDYNQIIKFWDISIEGGKKELSSSDHFGNLVDLVSIESNSTKIKYDIVGEIETKDTSGITKTSKQDLPLWCYTSDTKLTKPGNHILSFYKKNPIDFSNIIKSLHALSNKIRSSIKYKSGTTDYKTNAEEAFRNKVGVCQDHTHIFLSILRLNNLPCKYVSGFFLPKNKNQNLAMHAWAEVFVEDLGWIGFDISNGVSPDDSYVVIAKGFDYNNIAPVRGIINGEFVENQNLELSIEKLDQ